MTHTLLVVSLLLSQADALEGARGSSDGFWAFGDAGPFIGRIASPTTPSSETVVGGSLGAVVGWGFPLEGRRLALSAGFRFEPASCCDAALVFPGMQSVVSASRINWSPLTVRAALVDALFDDAVTGLRLTPLVGIDVPTRAFDRFPFLGVGIGFQLERRIGPVELAYRAVGGVDFYTEDSRQPSTREGRLDHRLLAEVWVLPNLSVALALGFGSTWAYLRPEFAVLFPGANNTGVNTHSTSSRLSVNWGFTKFFGIGLDFGTPSSIVAGNLYGATRPPFFDPGSFRVGLALWARTDPLIQRNWLDR